MLGPNAHGLNLTNLGIYWLKQNLNNPKQINDQRINPKKSNVSKQLEYTKIDGSRD